MPPVCAVCWMTNSRIALSLADVPSAGMVQTQWGPVKLKTAQGYGITHVKPEFEDAAALAREHGVPYQAVLQEVLGQLQQRESK